MGAVGRRSAVEHLNSVRMPRDVEAVYRDVLASADRSVGRGGADPRERMGAAGRRSVVEHLDSVRMTRDVEAVDRDVPLKR